MGILWQGYLMPMLCEMLRGPASGMAVEVKKTSDEFENQSVPPAPLGVPSVLS